MKVKSLVGLFIIMPLLIILLDSNVSASWVAFTPQQLIQNSDVILIGQIAGPVVGKSAIFKIDGASGSTLWKVNVLYYLKGDQKLSEFIVATPGTKNSFVNSPNNYRLDEWGNTVLLFLQKSNKIYQPITPGGVVALNSTQYHCQQDEQLNGKSILKEFSIMDDKFSPQEKTEFEKYIAGTNIVVAPSTSDQISGRNWFLINYKPIIIVVILLLIVLVIIFFRKRLLK